MPEKKQDARVRYTKMMIRNSLLELLSTKPVSYTHLMSSMSLCISELSYAESAHTASGLKPKVAICRFILSECTVESRTFPGVVCTSVISPCLASQV